VTQAQAQHVAKKPVSVISVIMKLQKADMQFADYVPHQGCCVATPAALLTIAAHSFEC
jgi:hypothetical protein